MAMTGSKSIHHVVPMDPSDSKGGAENVRESAKSLFKALAYHESSVSQPVPGWEAHVRCLVCLNSLGA
jgi:hypothetical protein